MSNTQYFHAVNPQRDELAPHNLTFQQYAFAAGNAFAVLASSDPAQQDLMGKLAVAKLVTRIDEAEYLKCLGKTPPTPPTKQTTIPVDDQQGSALESKVGVVVEGSELPPTPPTIEAAPVAKTEDALQIGEVKPAKRLPKVNKANLP